MPRTSRLRLALAATIGYALGSAPTADVVSRAATAGSVDLRETGSRNPGAANAMQVLGKQWGAAVFVGDFAKGALAAALGRVIAGDGGAYVAGSAAVAGHNWPVWTGFRGGKGVATAAGTCLVVFPPAFPIVGSALVAGLVSARSTERAVVLAAPTWIVSATLWAATRRSNRWGPRPGAGLVLNAAATSAMVLGKFAAARAFATPPA